MMQKNKWIITHKFGDKWTPGAYWYNIIPVDLTQGDTIEAYSKYLWSKQDFALGTYTDHNLTPVSEQYEKLDTDDTAVIEMTSNPLRKTPVKQLAIFGRRFGEFNLLIDVRNAPFVIERGHTILLRRGYHEFAPGVPIFQMLYNLMTKKKAEGFPKSKYDFGDCDKVFVMGTDFINPNIATPKHLLAYSKKFGYISFLAYEDEPEFSSRIGDNLVIERYYDRNKERNSYNILSNVTIDKLRTEFLQKTK